MRTAGILMPIFSLPSEYGIGDFGNSAYEFIDIINQMGFKIWQILPLNPMGEGNSPYKSYSSFAGDEIYISIDLLKEQGLIDMAFPTFDFASNSVVEYSKVRALKTVLLKNAFKNFYEKNLHESEDYISFSKTSFVYEYAVFITLKNKFYPMSWNKWPLSIRNWIKDKSYDLSEYEQDINYQIFLQYTFLKQWLDLKEYANAKGIKIMGDIPIYVSLDSLDVWKNQKAFLLNRYGSPKFIAGVPPDYFSKNGQLWGNPIYNWDYLDQNDYDFWIKRIQYSSDLYDIIRLDHFRGFDTYWKINARNKTAKKGEWVEAKGYELFTLVEKTFPDLEIIAEDLGHIRPEVIKLRDDFGLKGMKIMQFSSFVPPSEDLVVKDKKEMVIYTGTHDNQTIVGYYNSLTKEKQDYILQVFTEKGYDTVDLVTGFLQMCFYSIEEYAIVPVQDILGLDDASRTNTPGTVGPHNWSFRLDSLRYLREKIDYINKLLKSANRL